MSTALATEAQPNKLADQKFCHACANVLHHTAAHCPRCGARQGGAGALALAEATSAAAPSAAVPHAGAAPLAAHHVYCRGCGAGIHESAPACPKCGAPQQAAQANAGTGSGRNRTTAALLALLLGGIGAHKFYLGSIFVGLLYLVFCWTFIPALISLIEGIHYLTLSDQEFARRY